MESLEQNSILARGGILQNILEPNSIPCIPYPPYGVIAQSVEQLTLNQRVAGSSPAYPKPFLIQTMKRPLALLVLFFPFFFLCASEGLHYTHLSAQHQIHLLEVDPKLYEITPVKALDNGIGRETVSSLNARYGALASINGGFFKIGGAWDGRAAGALKIGEWIALPFKPRGCIGWSEEHTLPIMDRLLTKIQVCTEERQISCDGLNCPRAQKEMVIYTPGFHRTTLTLPDGEELIVVNEKVQSIKEGGSSKIPENGFVVSIHQDHPLYHTLPIGTPIKLSILLKPQLAITSAQDWEACPYIVGGTPLLLHEEIDPLDFTGEQVILSFITKRHARTAIGVLPNGHWLFVVVDNTPLYPGMTLDELTHLMKSLGCTRALNLDGGGSATMVYNNQVVNTPCGDECAVSDALLILPKRKQEHAYSK